MSDTFNITSRFTLYIISKSFKKSLSSFVNPYPYQSEDPSPTIPTYRQKEEKGKKSGRL